MPPRVGGPRGPPPPPIRSLGPPGPPGPRGLMSRLSPSLADRVFFSSTFRRTSPLNLMGWEDEKKRFKTLIDWSHNGPNSKVKKVSVPVFNWVNSICKSIKILRNTVRTVTTNRTCLRVFKKCAMGSWQINGAESKRETLKTTVPETKSVMSLSRCVTLLLRIFCTGSESSNTTKPKFGSFPPLLILSSRTVPYSVHRGRGHYSHKYPTKHFAWYTYSSCHRVLKRKGSIKNFNSVIFNLPQE